tara:strand:- start:113739 stop:114374 length:636 start_codon:yes stop_codon:yes gene_type:complete
MSLFTKAKKVTKTTATKKEHTRVQPEGVDQDELFEMIGEFEEIETKSKKLKARGDILKGSLKEIGLDAYLGKYEEDRKNPGTIMIEAINGDKETGQFMFVPTDRYVTVRTEEQADELEEKFGENLIERNTTYSFDNKMLEKYSDIISQLIEESDDIKEADKGKLFVATETYKVVSGTIDSLNNLAEDMKIKDVFEGLKPVVMMKNAQVITS